MRNLGSVARHQGPQQPARFPGCRPTGARAAGLADLQPAGRHYRLHGPCDRRWLPLKPPPACPSLPSPPHVAVSQTLVWTDLSRRPVLTPRAGGLGGQYIHSSSPGFGSTEMVRKLGVGEQRKTL